MYSVRKRERDIKERPRRRSGAASVECYGWAEIAVALETDQLSTMSHALPCTQSDEEELACNAVCHRDWDALRNRPSGALMSEHVTAPTVYQIHTFTRMIRSGLFTASFQSVVLSFSN